mgnify:CR=1 FL=1
MHSYYKKLWHIYLSGRFYAGGGNESLSVRLLSRYAEMQVYADGDPCGCYPNLERCTCTPAQIQAYLGKISQPFLDRIDLCVEAGRVDYENLTEQKKGEASAEIRMRVCRVRNLQKERYEGKKIRRNTQLEGELLKKYCALGTKEEAMMRQAFERFSLTARSYHRILRVARTIADLDGREKISEEHLSEALGYRMVDKKYWGR